MPGQGGERGEGGRAGFRKFLETWDTPEYATSPNARELSNRTLVGREIRAIRLLTAIILPCSKGTRKRTPFEVGGD